MAKMIPTQLPSRTDDEISNAERRVFPLLERGPGTAEWWVVHSVRVQSDNKKYKNSREIDFLIMIPGHGLVCLEIKGDSYDVENGQWIRKHPSNRDEKGKPEPLAPDRQSELAMDVLRQALVRAAKGPDARFSQAIREMPMWYGVAFTQERWGEGYEWATGCLFLDADITLNVELLSKCISDHVGSVSPRRSGSRAPRGRQHPVGGDVFKFILRALGREHESRSVVTTRPNLTQIERELLRLTEEQYQALEMVESDGRIVNDRVLFTGVAGTGKTMLAMELAVRRHKAGERVALVCHSEILGNWLRRQLPEIPAVGTPIQALGRALDPSADPNRELLKRLRAQDVNYLAADDSFGGDSFPRSEEVEEVNEWVDRTSHDFLEEMALELTTTDKQFDYLIVDELQHFVDQTELDVLDLALKGSLSSGRWAMFGDFMHQAVLRWRGAKTLDGSTKPIVSDVNSVEEYLEPVYNLFRISTVKASTTICRLVLSFLSQFFQSRRHFSSQAKDRSTTHRFGSTTKVCSSLRFTTSTAAPNRPCTAVAKGFPV